MAGDEILSVLLRVPHDVLPRPRLDVECGFSSGITAIQGPSGAGKTTLLLAIAGLLGPETGRIELAGRVLFDGERGTEVPAHSRRVALVFQSLALFPHLTALENVAYGVPQASRAERRRRALEWLGRTRVAHLAERLPASLSGGEAQRVAIARALASEPKALLLDEPFSALDDELRQELGTELRSLVEELGLVTLLVTHHREDAQRLGVRRITLREGRLAER
jgi:ABC-type sulfate/molybdate transport systems ATPase subunit